MANIAKTAKDTKASTDWFNAKNGTKKFLEEQEKVRVHVPKSYFDGANLPVSFNGNKYILHPGDNMVPETIAKIADDMLKAHSII